MGSYAELRVADFYLGGTKNHIDPMVMTIFREADRQSHGGEPRDIVSERGVAPDDIDGDQIEFVRYVCPVQHAIDRLEVMGFTLDVAARGFRRGLDQQIEHYEEWSEKNPEVFSDRLALLRSLDLESWLQGLRDIHERGLRPVYWSDHRCSRLSSLLQYMLCEEGHDLYGFPGDEHRHFLRLVLEASKPDDEVVYDLTDLALGGWVDTSRELVEAAEWELAHDFLLTRRVIVLTEGATDSRILAAALRFLYPHLTEFFHFLDFQSANLGGGAGTLANIVKAFSGAGIANRTVAVFDNDAAAHDAIRSIDRESLPASIHLTTYPTHEPLVSYPTIGPAGKTMMDVNGLSGSIELYLGPEALLGTDGELIPIQWRGYLPGVGQYQANWSISALP